jgi:hypothetical protein
MSDLVARLRNWREVHLARLHILMEEAADEMARLRSDNSRRANLEQGLRDGIERLSQNGDCPGRDNAANEDNTPAANATPSEGSVQSECTLTAEEREAVAWFARVGHSDDGGRAATLRSLLERL